MEVNKKENCPKQSVINQLFESIHTIQELKNELNILDIDDAKKALKKLQAIVQDKQKTKAQLFETRC